MMHHKLQILEDVFINHINDFSAFFHVASQPIRIPGKNAVIFAFVDRGEHLTKQGTFSWLFGGFLFNDDLSYVDVEALCKLATFSDLIIDGANLSLWVIRGFSGIEDILE